MPTTNLRPRSSPSLQTAPGAPTEVSTNNPSERSVVSALTPLNSPSAANSSQASIPHDAVEYNEIVQAENLRDMNGGDGGDSGGALKIRSSALVSLRGCKLSSNQANYGAGIYAGDTATVNLYSTSFDGNTHTHFSGKGDDIYVSGASATVHSTCPPDWSGTPAAGSDLDTYIYYYGSTYYGTISGTKKSFDIG